MTRTLILMRHAKSSWDDPLLADHDRVLNGRGRKSATALGNWLRQIDVIPDAAVISSSVRTVETFERLALTCPCATMQALYHAGPDTMMRVLRAQTSPTLLILGHNPGIAEFAERVVISPPDHPRFADYPTGATLIARWDIDDWGEASWARAKPIDFVIPRELEA